jgi:hypothetical protein
MFPEYMAIDLTFGTNVQRRPLFLAAGIDGCNKSFTMFRAFTPSKSFSAMHWIIHQAMPKLMGSDTLRNVSVVTSDQEDSLVGNVTSAITEKIFPFAKHRLDYFHMFVLPWKKIVREESAVFSIIYNWIRTWFYTLESKEEFLLSLYYLKDYMDKAFKSVDRNPAPLHESIHLSILQLVDKIVASIDSCANYSFMSYSTYGFVGSSFLEGINAQLKHGAISIDSRMNIDRSGYVQLQQVEEKGQRNLT